jgi:predicted metal-dependent hydrolase
MHNSERGIMRLRQLVDAWASKLEVTPRLVRVQRMTRKWGSCSARGTITLAADLAEQDRRFQDFVVAHELLHLRVPNHGRLFKALMTAHVPNWRYARRYTNKFVGRQQLVLGASRRHWTTYDTVSKRFWI